MQLRLPTDVRRDYARFDRHLHADLANPTLVQARHAARTLGEAHGWSHWLATEVDRALVIALSGHTAGDPIRLSELAPVLRRRGLAVERTAEVLNHLGLLDDDRTPAFEGWLDHKLHGMTQASAATSSTGCAPYAAAGHAPTPAAPRPSGATSTASARSCWAGHNATTTSAKSPATTYSAPWTHCTAAAAASP